MKVIMNQLIDLPEVDKSKSNFKRMNFGINKLVLNAVCLLVVAVLSINCGSSQIALPGANEQGFSAGGGESVDEKVIVIKAGELIKEYRENQTTADEKYRGKLMSVSGEVSGTLKAPGYAWISVRGEGNFSSSDPNPLGVGCILAEPVKIDVTSLKTSQKVTITGKNDGMQKAKMLRDGEYVTLQNCRIDDKPPGDSVNDTNSNKPSNTATKTPAPPVVEFPDASTGKLPTDEEINALLQRTIRDLADAIETEDFTQFKTTVSKGAIAYNVTPERLKAFYGNKVKLPYLRKIIGAKPVFSRKPFVGEYTLTKGDKTVEVYPALNLNGVYEDTDFPVNFEVQYLAEGKEWKVSIFNFTPK